MFRISGGVCKFRLAYCPEGWVPRRLESNPSYVENRFEMSRGLVPLLARIRDPDVVETSSGSDRSPQTTVHVSCYMSPLTGVPGDNAIDGGAGYEELCCMLQE